MQGPALWYRIDNGNNVYMYFKLNILSYCVVRIVQFRLVESPVSLISVPIFRNMLSYFSLGTFEAEHRCSLASNVSRAVKLSAN